MSPVIQVAKAFALFSRINNTIHRYVSEHQGWCRAARDMVVLVSELLRVRGVKGLIQSIREYTFYANSYSRPDLNAAPAAGKSLFIRPPLQLHSASVDIIICVHNALEDLKRCIDSVLAHTGKPYALILVDDGSDAETAAYLAELASMHDALLIRNVEAKGYTLAANQGLRAASGDFALLLNSDTIVTPGWLDRMVACAESDPGIGMVGPLSNTASWQSIPEVEREGDWAENNLPEGLSISGLGDLLSRYSGRLYPSIAFLNGFCLLLKRALLDQVGYFDEANFGRGYGEENDYCLRARKLGWSLAVADDAYVYHAQSRSYSSERRIILSGHAARALESKHGRQIIAEGVYACRHDRVLTGIRARSRAMLERWQVCREGRKRWQGKRLLFILPLPGAGGGGNVVIQEAEAMVDMGVEVTILNLETFRQTFMASYQDIDRRIRLIFVKNDGEIAVLASFYDALVATANISAGWMSECKADEEKAQIKGYYIQDFEPHFYEKGTRGYQVALQSYTLLPDMVRFTKTEWNRLELLRQVGVAAITVGPSVNIDLFRPRPRCDGSWPKRPLRIAAMIRPGTPRRSPGMTMEVLQDISLQHGAAVEVILFGCLNDDPAFLTLPHDFSWRNEGVLTPPELACLFNEIDIFVDFSAYQAMGLTAMEAMACGAVVIVPRAGGADSFLIDGVNGIMVDTTSKKLCIASLNRLIRNNELRVKLQRRALSDIIRFHPDRAASKILEALFGESRLSIDGREDRLLS